MDADHHWIVHVPTRNHDAAESKLIEAGRPDMQTTLDSEKSVEELR